MNVYIITGYYLESCTNGISRRNRRTIRNRVKQPGVKLNIATRRKYSSVTQWTGCVAIRRARMNGQNREIGKSRKNARTRRVNYDLCITEAICEASRKVTHVKCVSLVF